MNASILGWLERCDFYQKILDKDIGDYAKIKEEIDLEDIEHAEVVRLLAENTDAVFKDNHLVFFRRLTMKEYQLELDDAKGGLNYWIEKINKTIAEKDSYREQIDTYLKKRNKEIKGLNL